MDVDLERQLRDELAILMDLSTVAEAETVRREVIELHDEVRALDSNTPEQWAVRMLYEYVDWRSRDALGREICWLKEEQAAIDRALLSILDQSRIGRSSEEIYRARSGIGKLKDRIDRLEMGADHAQALRSLLNYVDDRARRSFDLAERSEFEMKRDRSIAERDAIQSRRLEPPTIEWER